MRRPRLRRAAQDVRAGREAGTPAAAPAAEDPVPSGAANSDATLHAPTTGDEGSPGDVALEASHVWLAYRAMLGRSPSEDEVANQVAALGTPDELYELIRASAEYALKAPPAPTIGTRPNAINWWHRESAAYTHAPGTISSDAVAVVGEEGVLFLYGGTNSILDQFVGDVTMSDDWVTGWADLMRRRARAMTTGGRRAASVVVPDKLAVYRDLFPAELHARAPRPVERLLGELALPLLYPVEEMQRAREDGPVYLRTDTHLSFRGNHALYAAIMAELGVEALPADGLAAMHPNPTSGDLGSRFEPQIIEIATIATTMGSARITEDNRAAVERGGGHIGSRRVYRNDTAPDPRCVVLFGDSYGFGSTAYQGLSWFLAQTFRDVHFVWTPFGWDPGYADRAGAELVISETAERFVPRVPSFQIDVDEICARAVSRGAAVGPDAVFSDRPAGDP